MTHRFCIACCMLVASVVQATENSAAPPLDSYLSEGKLESAAEALNAYLEETPSDAEAMYGLGVVQVLQAIEGLAQDLYRYGLKSSSQQIPIVRLPVPQNPQPEKLTYEKWRSVLEQFNSNLERAATTLGQVNDPKVKLRIPVGLVRLDLDGNGTAGPDETFWKIFTRVAWRAAKLSDDQKQFPIAFDAADVHWMIGYTHLLRAITEAWLAYDTETFFDQTAPWFFAGADSPNSGLGTGSNNQGFNIDQIADAVAAAHLARFTVADPRKMSLAREHLLTMIDESRLCWKCAIAEQDDDREWIPNANQTSLTPLTVNDQRIEAWRQFLDEAHDVLQGEKLLPHWRVNDGRGINLKRVFEEPRTFDLVLWVHGAATVPYLEEGELVTRETARMLNGAFQGRFLAFAVWFQ